ncbi:hypothetical protein SELMODRAFT_402576 [Selaginella moellendorffii]|uniref:Uncharacterized protein n=1 Tax=Selaginella moellendorffii TaxID=88036 RepID=D8QR43_SELML|nr:hypothetical protein SELMODRAFT_402576 [Selaginella moellendorffii]
MAKEALEALKRNKGDPIQIQQSLDVLAYGSWEGISKHEIRKVVGQRLQKGSVLERRLNRQDLEVKPLPELQPPKPFFPQAAMLEFRTALEAWQCTPECKKKLSYLYTNISNCNHLQATMQAEVRMRQHWKSLVSESKWRSVLEFGTWFMAVSLQGFRNIAFELASDADRRFKELHDACAGGQAYGQGKLGARMWCTDQVHWGLCLAASRGRAQECRHLLEAVDREHHNTSK